MACIYDENYKLGINYSKFKKEMSVGIRVLYIMIYFKKYVRLQFVIDWLQIFMNRTSILFKEF
jgi:hypothetical protein